MHETPWPMVGYDDETCMAYDELGYTFQRGCGIYSTSWYSQLL